MFISCLCVRECTYVSLYRDRGVSGISWLVCKETSSSVVYLIGECLHVFCVCRSLCPFTYMFVCVLVCVYVRLCVGVYVCSSVCWCVYVHLCVGVYVRPCAYWCTGMSVCLCTGVSVCPCR